AVGAFVPFERNGRGAAGDLSAQNDVRAFIHIGAVWIERKNWGDKVGRSTDGHDVEASVGRRVTSQAIVRGRHEGCCADRCAGGIVANKRKAVIISRSCEGNGS